MSADDQRAATRVIIFVGGLKSSELFKKDERVWPPNFNVWKMIHHAMNPDHPIFSSLDELERTGLCNWQLEPGQVIRNVKFGCLTIKEVYGPFIDALNTIARNIDKEGITTTPPSNSSKLTNRNGGGNSEGSGGGGVSVTKVIPFGYDFTKGIAHAASSLCKFIQTIGSKRKKHNSTAQQPPPPPPLEIDIVTHSFGGLVAYYAALHFMKDILRSGTKLRRIVCLACPFGGVKEIVFNLFPFKTAVQMICTTYGQTVKQVIKMGENWIAQDKLISNKKKSDRIAFYSTYQSLFDLLPVELIKTILNADRSKVYISSTTNDKLLLAKFTLARIRPAHNIVGEDLTGVDMVVINVAKRIVRKRGVTRGVRNGDESVTNSGTLILHKYVNPNEHSISELGDVFNESKRRRLRFVKNDGYNDDEEEEEKIENNCLKQELFRNIHLKMCVNPFVLAIVKSALDDNLNNDKEIDDDDNNGDDDDENLTTRSEFERDGINWLKYELKQAANRQSIMQQQRPLMSTNERTTRIDSACLNNNNRRFCWNGGNIKKIYNCKIFY